MTTRTDEPKPACWGMNPELFFPPGDGTRAARLQIEEAKAVCRGCPLRVDCLTGALQRREEYGVFGGMSETERRNITRAQPHTNARNTATRLINGPADAASQREYEIRRLAAMTWTTQEIREACAAYYAGDRDTWAIAGTRVYDMHRRTAQHNEAVGRRANTAADTWAAITALEAQGIVRDALIAERLGITPKYVREVRHKFRTDQRVAS